MNLSAKDLSSIPHVEFRNAGDLKGRKITGVSTDTRTTTDGDLFVAIRGEHFDGHVFLAKAFEQGAVAAVVDQHGDYSAASGHPLLVVSDTRKALGGIAHAYRMKFKIPIVAIAGSNGKTTTKEMTARVLSTRYRVLSTKGNHNNDIGVPETLFQLTSRHQAAVVEIGTNHPGELGYLCSILEPTHGLITNIGSEHLEYFGSVDGVAKEEGELFRRIAKKKGGLVFVNADDRRIGALARRNTKKRTFGFRARTADVRGRIAGTDAVGRKMLSVRNAKSARETTIALTVPGEHTANNALAAVAIGLAFNVPPKEITKALESFSPPGARMNVIEQGSVVIIDDTYNANPESMIAAVKLLHESSVRGKKIAVLADMLELGKHAEREHRNVGKAIAETRIDHLLTFGPMAKFIREGSGLSTAIHFEQKNVMAEFLAELVSSGDIVLVKGSRGMRMEDIVTFLRERVETGAFA
jgi:UDP-N-acetylmuramoyl-tripeptide--D-alanyl-D-alanine ligase